jgi:hypothetical protein
MKRRNMIAAGLAAALVAGCGGGADNPGQPTADERRQLDNIAAKADADAQTFDTSADSLVPAEGTPAEVNGTASQSANGAATVNAAAPGNGAATAPAPQQ